MKKSNKYKYIQGKQLTDPGTGTRMYEISNYKLPSVTTVLGATKNQDFLIKWKAKVGEAEAERIKNHSTSRGSAVHKFLEHHVLGTNIIDLTPIGKEALPMANKMIEVGLTPIDEYYGSEVTLYYPGLFAGSTDLVCMHNGMESIVDFKTSNKPKIKEYITDYYLQCAAYALAHDYVYGSEIKQCVVMIVTPDLYYQEFNIQGHELRKAKHEFLKRLDMFYNLQDRKENNEVLTPLLKTFEEDK